MRMAQRIGFHMLSNIQAGSPVQKDRDKSIRYDNYHETK